MPELLPCAPGSPEWLAARRQGVTATDIVTILGLSSWNSPYSLFWQKMGQIPETPDNDRFRLGRELEPYVANCWARSRPESFLFLDGGLYRSSERPWQMASPDRIINMSRPDGRPLRDHQAAVMECKTWADNDRSSWGIPRPIYTGRVGDQGEHLDPEPPFPADRGQVPAAVRAQVLWQMDVMGVAAGHVGVVFLPSGEFRSYTIAHEPEKEHDWLGWAGCPVCVDQNLMREAGEEFMARLRLELPAPDPDASAATLAAVKARFAKTPDKQAEVSAEIWAAWDRAKQKVETWTERACECESNLREQAGEASVYTVDGQPVARRITGEAHVKAHTRHSDYLKRIAPKEADSE